MKMIEYRDDIEHLRSERHASANRSRPMSLQQALDTRKDDLITSGAIVESAKVVMQLLRPIYADRHADMVFRKKVNDFICQQGRVGGETEIDRFADRFRSLLCIFHGLADDFEVQQCLATKKRQRQAWH